MAGLLRGALKLIFVCVRWRAVTIFAIMMLNASCEDLSHGGMRNLFATHSRKEK